MNTENNNFDNIKNNFDNEEEDQVGGGDSVPGQTSSIGNIGPEPVPSSFQRYKTFNPELQDYEMFISWYKKVRNFNLKTGERISVRSIVRKDALAKFLDEGDANLIEGIIDLEGCGIDELNEYAIVYIGKNDESRERSQRRDLASQLNAASSIFEQNKSINKEPQLPKGIKYIYMKKKQIEDADVDQTQISQIHSQYKKLLKVFGWQDSDIEALIENSNIDLVVDFNNNPPQVLASGIAETAELQVSSHKFKIVELTEAVVHPIARGSGLYHFITQKQLYRAFIDHGVNLAFGESNLDQNSRGVLYVAAKNGRKPGNIWEYKGRKYSVKVLEAHVPAGGSEYSNFLPTYITKEKYEESLRRES